MLPICRDEKMRTRLSDEHVSCTIFSQVRSSSRVARMTRQTALLVSERVAGGWRRGHELSHHPFVKNTYYRCFICLHYTHQNYTIYCTGVLLMQQLAWETDNPKVTIRTTDSRFEPTDLCLLRSTSLLDMIKTYPAGL